MCGIIGAFNFFNAEQAVLNGLHTIQQRGRDHYGIATEQSLLFAATLFKLKKSIKTVTRQAMAHCLHAVVSRIKQPFVGKGILIANCEIYNWKKLAKKNHLKPRNDSELLFQLLEKRPLSSLSKTINELDGDFAFAYWRSQKIFLARDLIGIKPLWYAFEKKRFAFASEAKALYAMGFQKASELNPRKTLCFDIDKKKMQFFSKPFFVIQEKEKNTFYSEALFEKRLLEAVHKRIPNQKFGVLFSGGIDSLMIAKACQKLGAKPTLFVAGIQEKDCMPPKDILHARKVARTLNLSLREHLVSFSRAEKLLPRIVSDIETADPVKVGIALPLFLACQKARQDNYKILLTGMGADGLLGGFYRQQNARNLNRDCLSYVLKAFETDLYRDDAIAMQSAVELRVPYYDLKFVEFVLQIPARTKIENQINKKPLRMLAIKWNLPQLLAFQPKKALQYGSNADKLIAKLTKKKGFKTKGQFLESFLQEPKQRLGALISGGKDGWLAAFIQHQKNYSIACLISLQSKNPASFMFHTPNIKLVKKQGQASNIPLVLGQTSGQKETELKDLKKTIQKAQKRFKLDGIVNGALLSNYQRKRIEKACDACGLKIFSPLWQKNQAQELEELLQNKFEVVFSSIAALGLSKEWLGKSLTQQTIHQLKQLHKKYAINVAGEGGEFETLVLDCPLFKKRLIIKKAEPKMQNPYTGVWNVKKTCLFSKANP